VIQQNWDFSSDPHKNSRNFIGGKTSGFWAQQSRNFWNQTCISETMSVWSFGVFQENWPTKFVEFCCWNFNWWPLLISEYYHSIFCSKVQGSMLNKTIKFFTGDLWTVANTLKASLQYIRTSISAKKQQFLVALQTS